MRDIDWKKLTFTKVGVGTGLTPDSPEADWSTEIEDAEEIIIFTDSTAAGHTSANWDLNVFIGFYAGVARDGTLTWETTPSFEETGLGDNTVVRIRVADANAKTLSGVRMKITADCNADNLLADVYVWVRKRRIC